MMDSCGILDRGSVLYGYWLFQEGLRVILAVKNVALRCFERQRMTNGNGGRGREKKGEEGITAI